MQIQLNYRFPSAPAANRFINTLRHWDSVQVRLGRNSMTVNVRYEPELGRFDSTASELDDLARQHGGDEVH